MKDARGQDCGAAPAQQQEQAPLSTAPVLRLDVSCARGAFTLEAKFVMHARIMGLVGASGAGKSTLLMLIAGLLTPSRGMLQLGARVLVDTRARIFVPAHRRAIGVVFQDRRLFPHMSVAANLRYGEGGLFAPRRGPEAQAALEALVDVLAIKPLLARRADRLSGGEAARVALARALLAKPALLLLDEPCAGLDAARRADVLAMLEAVARTTQTPMLLVSHDEADVARLCTQTVRMENGRTVAP